MKLLHFSIPPAVRLGLVVSVLAFLLRIAPLPEFWVTLANYIGLYGLVALGLVLLTGVAGMTSFGQAAFVGLGAYASAYLSTVWGVSPWIGLLAGIAITVVAAYCLGWITLGLSGHFLPLCTIAWGISLFYLFGNLDYLGKFDGITGIPSIVFFGMDLSQGRDNFVLIWLFVIWSCVALHHLLNSRSGRVLKALKGGVLMAESCGVATMEYKLLAFILAAVLAALSGWLYAHLQRAVNPTAFNLTAGIGYLIMAVVGGVGYLGGAVVGAIVITLLNNWLQNILPTLLGQSGNYEVIVSGILLIALLQKSPKGIWYWVDVNLSPPLLRLCNILRPPGVKKPLQGSGPALNSLSINAGSKGLSANTANTVNTKLPPRPRAQRGQVVLKVKEVCKSFGGLKAVNAVGFEVKASQIVGLIGPNGAGKSTLFNLISGVLPLSSGSIEFLGHAVQALPARTRARLGMGRSFQHVRLMGQMSVLDNVLIGAHTRAHSTWLGAIFRFNQAEELALREIGQECLRLVGLQDVAQQLADTLSLGQQRLLEIARALASDPILLLLDEPAAGLRHFEKQELQRTLKYLSAECGISVLIVEHDMDFVMGLVDELVVMEFGNPIAHGSPAQVRDNPLVIEAYLGGID